MNPTHLLLDLVRRDAAGAPVGVQAISLHTCLLLADITLKATFLLALTMLIVALSRRASAAWRHYIWMVGLVAAIALPFLSGALPHVPLALRETPTATASPVSPFQPSGSKGAPSAASVGAASTASASDTPAAVSAPVLARPVGAVVRHALPIACVFVWALGVLVALAQWMAGGLALRRLVAASVEIPVQEENPIAAAYRSANCSLAGKRHLTTLRIATTPRVRTPLTWGWLRPVILLPADSDTWSGERLRAAFLHELAHVQRRDWLLQRLAHFACALLWFHPLVWRAAAAARAESEKASDDLVLAAGIPATHYADYLLEAAAAVRPMAVRPLDEIRHGAVAMVSPRQSGVEARLRALLATDRSRRLPSGGRRAGTVIVALLLTLPIVALHPIVRAQETTAADPFAGPGVVVRKIEGLTQYISKDTLRAVRGGANPRLLVEYDRAARDNAPAQVASGYKTTLPNGFTEEVVGLVRLGAYQGYWQYADPQGWQSPDGKSLAKPQDRSRLIQSGMPVSMTHGIAPVLIVSRLTPPVTSTHAGYSSFQYPLGMDDSQEYSWIVPYIHTTAPAATTTSEYSYALFPPSTHTVALRNGVAIGSWTTVATVRHAITAAEIQQLEKSRSPFTKDIDIRLDDRPRLSYLDATGNWREECFLADGKRLGAEDRRIVAIDDEGKSYPLDSSRSSGGLRQFGIPIISLADQLSDDTQFGHKPALNLSSVREFRLETRPFERVEFRNVHIPPQPPAENASSH